MSGSQSGKPADALDAALYWYAEGWRVFPCAPNKASTTGQTPNGFKDAATTEAEVRAFNWRGCLVGGVPGPDLVVLDADLYKGADLNALPDPSDLATRVHETPRGGLHFVWRARPGAAYGNGARPDLGDGFEIRHVGGYVILPSPSSGYKTRKPAGEIAAAPAWLELPARATTEIFAGPSRVAQLEAGPKLKAGGGRHRDYVVRKAGQLREQTNLTGDALAAALIQCYAERCEPADLGDTQWIADIARDAIRRYPTGAPASPVESELRRLEVMTLADMCRLPDPPESDRIVGDLVVRGQRTLIAGGTGEGKTSLVMQLVAAMTASTVGSIFSGDCLGQPVHSVGRVLIIDAEQGVRTIKRRAAEYRITGRENIDIVRVPDGLRLDRDVGDVEALAEVLSARPYDAVVLDPFYKLHSGDSNSDREIKQLMATLDGWREQHGFALMMPTHTRKLAPGVATPTIADVFGSSAITWGAEIVLMIQRKRVGYSHLHVVKDRDGELSGRRFGLYFDRESGGFTLDPDGDKTAADKTDELRDAVYRYVGDNPGCSQRDVRFAKTIGGSERSRVAMLDELIGLDEVVTATGKSGALEHRLARDPGDDSL